MSVYRDAEQATTKTGELEIVDVRGPHLSLTNILSGERETKVKDQVKITIVQ